VGRFETRASHEFVSIVKSLRNLRAVFEALTLLSDRALTLAELTIEQLLYDAVFRHPGNVACPSDLGMFHVVHMTRAVKKILRSLYVTWHRISFTTNINSRIKIKLIQVENLSV